MVALKTLRERGHLAERLSEQAQQDGLAEHVKHYETLIQETRQHIPFLERVLQQMSGYNAARGGDDLTLDAVFATQKVDMSPAESSELKLQAAPQNADTRPPFVFLSPQDS